MIWRDNRYWERGGGTFGVLVDRDGMLLLLETERAGSGHLHHCAFQADSVARIGIERLYRI